MKMKTQSKSSMINKFSVIVFIFTILISGTVSGQERTRRGMLPPSADTLRWDSTGRSVKDKKIESTVKSDVDGSSFYVPYKGFCRHELMLWLGGGFSSLNAFPTFGDRNYRYGGILGGGYGYHFNPHWSIGIGVELALYNMSMDVEHLQDWSSIQDQDGDAINYYANIENYTEKQRLYTVNIPVWVQYQTPLFDSQHEFYAALGFKLGIPLSAKYKIEDAQFVTYGYYGEWDQTLYDQRDLGYGDNTGKTVQENLHFNLICMGMADVGVKWDIGNPKLNLYTGIYFDMGFNDIVGKHDKAFLEYNNQRPENFKNNSVLTSQYTQTQFGRTNSFMDRVSTVALGLKVRLGFNQCTNKKTERSKSIDTRDKSEQKEVKEEPRAVKPIDYTSEPPVSNKPYYSADPLLEAEMKRASTEYGKLVDVVVLQVDGYEVNQSKLSPIMERMVDEKIRLLQRYNSDKYVIICEGHTCDLGREDFNLTLGQKRAEVIKEYLMTKGFNGDNIVPTSKGKTTPIVPNTSEANRKINRRVVFLIKEKK